MLRQHYTGKLSAHNEAGNQGLLMAKLSFTNKFIKDFIK